MSNVFESREFACELKFFLTPALAEAIVDWSRRNLQADPHGSGQEGDAYHVESVYHDSDLFDVFHRNGSYGRSKYRVRRYNDSGRVFLERKTKTNDLVSKRRALVDIGELERLRAGEPGRDWGGYWFHRRLLARQLKPVCRISYDRMARIGTSETGPVRLTLDQNLRACVMNQASFAARGNVREVLPGQFIMEMKYRHAVPAIFRRLLAEFDPVPRTISKYRLTCPVLGLARDARETATAPRMAAADA